VVEESNRIQYVRYTAPDNTSSPLYQRYIGDKTELWLFGSGLGEYTMFQQIGDSFLGMVDAGKDPELGRVMIGLGHSDTAFMVYKGDYNVVWTWALPEYKLQPYLNRLLCKPDLFMSNEPRINEIMEHSGYKTLRMCSGVNPRFFYPMNLERKGIGYCGVDNKGKDQRDIIIKPAQKYDFEWISRFGDRFLEITELNEWYNSKEIVLGMIHDDRQNISYMPTRVPETLASGTPLLTYRIHNLKDSLGFEYPYQSSSAEETAEMLEKMLNEYNAVLEEVRKYSEYVVEKHSYEKKLNQIFEELRKIK